MFDSIKKELLAIMRGSLLWTTLVIAALFICTGLALMQPAEQAGHPADPQSWEAAVKSDIQYVEQELKNLEKMEAEGYDLTGELSPGYSYLDYKMELEEELRRLRIMERQSYEEWQRAEWEAELARIEETLQDPELTESARAVLEQDKLWYQLSLEGYDQDEIDRRVKLLINENWLAELEKMYHDGIISQYEYENEKTFLALNKKVLESQTVDEHNAYVLAVRILSVAGVFLFSFYVVFQSLELAKGGGSTGLPAPDQSVLARFIAAAAAAVILIAAGSVIAVLAGGILSTFGGITDRVIIGVYSAGVGMHYQDAGLVSLGLLVLAVAAALVLSALVLTALSFFLAAVFRRSVYAPALCVLSVFFVDPVLRMVINQDEPGYIYRLLPFPHLHLFHQVSGHTSFYSNFAPPGQSVGFLIIYTALFLLGAYLLERWKRGRDLEKMKGLPV